MGTTCIALLLQGSSASVAHIGDSRLYRITSGDIEQLTRDHTKVAEMVRRGILTDDEARMHPERSMLYRAMGVRMDMQFDVMNAIALQRKDCYVMCTDGLSNLVEPEEMREIATTHPPQGACDMLVELANRRGGHDNITVQIIQVKGEESFLKKMLR
jgi:protein phosphatase